MSEETPNDVPNLAGTLLLDTFDLSMSIPGTNKPSGWVITLAGPAHPRTMALTNDAQRESLRKTAEIERAQVNGRKWKGFEDEDPQAARRKTVASIVGRIVTWTPVKFGAEPIEFSTSAAMDLFMNPQMGGYFSQLVDYLLSEKAFIPASPTS